MSVSFGLISDIHANYFALKEVLRELHQKDIFEIYCLGDIVGYGSQVNLVCELLRENGVVSIQGNHDFYLVSGEKCERSSYVNTVIDKQRKIISKDNFEWLASLDSEMNQHNIRMVHGGWNDYLEEYMVPSEEYFEDLEFGSYASGHTHKPLIWEGENHKYCNPGSVGQPRDGDSRASFAIFTGEKFNLHRVPYDLSKFLNQLQNDGYSVPRYQSMFLGKGI